MSSFQCPYCAVTMPITADTCTTYFPSFNHPNEATFRSYSDSCLRITFLKCPSCGEYSIFSEGKGKKVSDINAQIRPNSLAKQFPNYIPDAIRQDYEEACAIVHLSPKASATLSRRCLQGMIRDFWGIRQNNLYNEINELKDKIPSDLWSSIDALRQLGNIGAHMEKRH